MATSRIISTSAEPEFWTVLKTVSPDPTISTPVELSYISKRYLLKRYLELTDEQINECQNNYEK